MRPSTVKRAFFSGLLVAVLAVAAPAGASPSAAAFHGLRVEPAKTVHAVTLLDSAGQAREFPLGTDKWQLVVFGYTRCADVCPMTLHRTALLLKQLGDHGANLQPVFISIDGDRDTPEAVRDFTRKFDARIVGLTGKPETLQALANEFNVVVRRFRGRSALAYKLEHSSFMYLLDPRGRVRLLYPASSDLSGIAQDLRALWRAP
jgi:protein SCO1/2